MRKLYVFASLAFSSNNWDAELPDQLRRHGGAEFGVDNERA